MLPCVTECFLLEPTARCGNRLPFSLNYFKRLIFPTDCEHIRNLTFGCFLSFSFMLLFHVFVLFKLFLLYPLFSFLGPRHDPLRESEFVSLFFNYNMTHTRRHPVTFQRSLGRIWGVRSKEYRRHTEVTCRKIYI